MLRRLAPYMSKYKIYAILCPILMILEVSVDIIIPYLMSFVVDTGIANRDISYILWSFDDRLCALFGMTTGIISCIWGQKRVTALRPKCAPTPTGSAFLCQY